MDSYSTIFRAIDTLGSQLRKQKVWQMKRDSLQRPTQGWVFVNRNQIAGWWGIVAHKHRTTYNLQPISVLSVPRFSMTSSTVLVHAAFSSVIGELLLLDALRPKLINKILDMLHGTLLITSHRWKLVFAAVHGLFDITDGHFNVFYQNLRTNPRAVIIPATKTPLTCIQVATTLLPHVLRTCYSEFHLIRINFWAIIR